MLFRTGNKLTISTPSPAVSYSSRSLCIPAFLPPCLSKKIRMLQFAYFFTEEYLYDMVTWSKKFTQGTEIESNIGISIVSRKAERELEGSCKKAHSVIQQIWQREDIWEIVEIARGRITHFLHILIGLSVWKKNRLFIGTSWSLNILCKSNVSIGLF